MTRSLVLLSKKSGRVLGLKTKGDGAKAIVALLKYLPPCHKNPDSVERFKLLNTHMFRQHFVL